MQLACTQALSYVGTLLRLPMCNYVLHTYAQHSQCYQVHVFMILKSGLIALIIVT